MRICLKVSCKLPGFSPLVSCKGICPPGYALSRYLQKPSRCDWNVSMRITFCLAIPCLNSTFQWMVHQIRLWNGSTGVSFLVLRHVPSAWRLWKPGLGTVHRNESSKNRFQKERFHASFLHLHICKRTTRFNQGVAEAGLYRPTTVLNF